MNSEYGSTTYRDDIRQAVRSILTLKPDLVLVTGDMVAGQWKNLEAAQIRNMWRSFHDLVTLPLRRAHIPLAVTPGNHDAAPGYELDQQIYADEWKNRGALLARSKEVNSELIPTDLTRYPFSYSFNMRGVHFVSMNSTFVGGLPRSEREWLLSDLERATGANLKIVFGHVPLEPVAVGREREALFDLNLERTLYRVGVDYFIHGHHHAFFPGLLNSKIHQISVGALGAGQRKLIGSNSVSPTSFMMMEISHVGGVSIESCVSSDFSLAQNWSDLPTSIEWSRNGEGEVILKDLDLQNR